jgi:hypothetical protein
MSFGLLGNVGTDDMVVRDFAQYEFGGDDIPVRNGNWNHLKSLKRLLLP